ncbi:MAG: DNA polymerase III subunit chi [Rhodocyclaceae bacterium]
MEIKFYHNAPNRLMAACSIATKAVKQGRRIVVYAPDPEVSRRFDQALWSAQPLSFVPHVAAASPLAQRTPVVLTRDGDNAPHSDVLINLGLEPPADYERYALLVEVVSRDGEDRDLARRRWQYYKQQGYAIEAYDLNRTE